MHSKQGEPKNANQQMDGPSTKNCGINFRVAQSMASDLLTYKDVTPMGYLLNIVG